MGTTYRVYPDGARVPTEPCPDLSTITFGDDIESVRTDLVDLRAGVEEICGLLDVACEWNLSGVNPISRIEEAIGELISERDHLDEMVDVLRTEVAALKAEAASIASLADRSQERTWALSPNKRLDRIRELASRAVAS